MILKIEDLILSVNNLQGLINHPFKNIYGIEKKRNNLIEITEIEFIKIDDKHYGKG